MDIETKNFYDKFWPANVPYYDKTKEYMLATIRERTAVHALDAGTGHGVCAVVLSEIAADVTAVDISDACLSTAGEIGKKFERANITYSHQDLQMPDLPADSFDLVWCWGVAMMAPDPMKVMHNLMRVTSPGGTIYLGLYLKTWLSPVHQAVRHFCRACMNGPKRKKFVLNFFDWLTNAITRLRSHKTNLRDDNVSIQAQVDDWYYPPYKTFYSPGEIMGLFRENGFQAELIQDQAGRMRSAAIFVIRAVKRNATK